MQRSNAFGTEREVVYFRAEIMEIIAVVPRGVNERLRHDQSHCEEYFRMRAVLVRWGKYHGNDRRRAPWGKRTIAARPITL